MTNLSRDLKDAHARTTGNARVSLNLTHAKVLTEVIRDLLPFNPDHTDISKMRASFFRFQEDLHACYSVLGTQEVKARMELFDLMNKAQ